MYLDRNCQFCSKKAQWDRRTKDGPWAYMCDKCLRIHGYPKSKINTRIAPSEDKETENDR